MFLSISVYICYKDDIIDITVGLNFKLDVGLYRLDQQVACQRYRQNPIVAKSTIASAVDSILAAREKVALKPAFALAA